MKQRTLWGFLFIGPDPVCLEQFSRIFACIDQCLDFIYYFLAVFRIGDAEPFAGSIQYFDRSSLVTDQFIYHQRNEEFALQVFHVLRITQKSLDEFLALSEVIRSEAPEVHAYRSRVGGSCPFAVVVDVFHFSVDTLDFSTFDNRSQQLVCICTTDTA